jgi:hypothetical protein
MIGELVVIAVVVVLPATIVLGSLALVGLGVAGFALDPEERQLFRR